MSRGRANRGQGGFAGLELTLAVGFLLIPVACLVLTLPTWVERQTVARTAAREAARQLATAPSWSTGVAQADQAVAEIADNNGLNRNGVHAGYQGSLTRGSTVTVRVTVDIPAVNLPLFGATGGFAYTATHDETVDAYRSRS